MWDDWDREKDSQNKSATIAINSQISSWSNKAGQEFKTDNISDWYHTFWELYKHRIHLYIALCRNKSRINRLKGSYKCIRSKIHEDGLNVWEEWGMFLMVLHTPYWQISYHLDKEYWDKCDFAETEEKAKTKFDGHSSNDVLERLLKI